MENTIFGVYGNVIDLDNSLNELADQGYTEGDITIITKESSIDKIRVDNNTEEGIKNGAKTGGLLGGILGLIAGVGTLTVPGIGALFVTGPLAVALGITGIIGTTAAGAITGAIAGGLVTGLKELGIDENIARKYEEEVEKGNYLLCVYLKKDTDILSVEETLRNNGAYNINNLNLLIE